MSNFQPFVMERLMSQFEQDVEINLSESGVHPVKLRELIEGDPSHLERLQELGLNYPHVNGIPKLREEIAALYDGAGSENVLVTVGAIEANYISTRTLLEPGDEMVVMLPNYMQIWGIAKNHDIRIKTFHLKEDEGWSADLEELAEVASSRTRVIAVCNPNNPTGHILSEQEMDGIVAVAERSGAWILADEVYRGAERLSDTRSKSFFGRYDKVVATGSMSKAYGLPGLRLGWVVAPPSLIEEMWARHEYVTLSASILSNHLAAIALSPEVESGLLDRTRNYIRRGYTVLQEWMSRQGDLFSIVPPEAAAIAFVRYNADINSTRFVRRLIDEKGVLIVPGDHFGMDRFFRISFGLPHDYLRDGLGRIEALLDEVRSVSVDR